MSCLEDIHQFIFRFYSLGKMILLQLLSFFVLLCYIGAQCTNTITVGSHGRCVRVVQRTVDTDPDGIFGVKTESAVMNFQKQHSLKVDGIVGRQTWAKIYGVSNTGGTGAHLFNKDDGTARLTANVTVTDKPSFSETVMTPEKSKMNIILIVVVIVICLLAIPGAVQTRKVWRDRKLKSKLSDLQRRIDSPDTSLQDLLPSLQLLTSAVGNRLYIDPKTYIKKELLTVDFNKKPLGEGCFSSVYKGLLKCDYQSDPLPVAEALIAELTIMSNIGSHVNLLGVYGGVTENLHLGELFVIFEICERGSLLSYIKSKRFVDEFTLKYQNVNFVRPTHTLPEAMFMKFVACMQMLTLGTFQEAVRLSDNFGYLFNKRNIFTCNLFQYGYQTANGMDYISSRYVVHGNLALHNILLTNNFIVKIADFRIALDKVFNPKVSNSNRLPIKWMAPEAICGNEFSMHSDVWSFGVVLWELFTLGQEPFEDCHIFSLHSMESFCNQLKSGKKLNYPLYSPPEIYTLMKKCWNIDKDRRPSFEECKSIIGGYLCHKFPSPSKVLINLLENSQPYVNVKQSQTRQVIPRENFKYLTSKKENVYINKNVED